MSHHFFIHLRAPGELSNPVSQNGNCLIGCRSSQYETNVQLMLRQVPARPELPFFHLTQNEIKHRFIFINNLANYLHAGKGGF